MTALLFPGQGSQFVGMGRSLADAYPVARRTFEEADDLLGESLSDVMWNGPEDALTLTHTAQPAILTHSVAALRVLEERTGTVAAAAGHSLGEFSAHVAAGTLEFADALRAVRVRGQAMAEAGQVRPGTMAAVLGLADEEVESVCADVSRDDSVVVPANFNSDGQVVISGDVAAVERAGVVLPDRGARRVVPLNVSGAFHSPLMAPARDALAAHLAEIPFRTPTVPVVTNVTAEAVADGDAARDLLIRQLTAAVRWRASVATMVDRGVERFVEVGPGTVLTGLGRRNARGVPAAAFGAPEDLDALEG